MNCPVPNENRTDRAIRLGIGLLSILIGFFALTGAVQQIAFIVGGIALFTGMTGFCLLYQLLGISTNHSAK